MLPLWKLKRELTRLQLQVAQVPWFLFGKRRRTAYDAARPRLVSVTEGACPLQPDVAILLCYQPGGLQASFLAEVDHFRAQGFAPVVVSNLPLSAADLAALQARAHLIVQRPNYVRATWSSRTTASGFRSARPATSSPAPWPIRPIFTAYI